MTICFKLDKRFIILENSENENSYKDDVVVLSEPSYTLMSPRTVNFVRNPLVYFPNETLYFVMKSQQNMDMDTDIYIFVSQCRASKETKNFYLLDTSHSHQHLSKEDIISRAIQPYNLVSGEKLPPLPIVDRDLYRYMMSGLHTYYIYWKRGLGRTTTITVNNRSRIISQGGHMFHTSDNCVISLSNVFMSILIDYYRIQSGINKMDAQIAFIRDAEYRFLVFKYLKLVFVRFVSENNHLLPISSRIIVNESTDDAIIIKQVSKILSEYISYAY
jgi:hypothetical protein